MCSKIRIAALEGIDAISICRKMMGATFGSNAEPGTIRGDLGVSNSFNRDSKNRCTDHR